MSNMASCLTREKSRKLQGLNVGVWKELCPYCTFWKLDLKLTTRLRTREVDHCTCQATSSSSLTWCNNELRACLRSSQTLAYIADIVWFVHDFICKALAHLCPDEGSVQACGRCCKSNLLRGIETP
jgi:hypothetical protein